MTDKSFPRVPSASATVLSLAGEEILSGAAASKRFLSLSANQETWQRKKKLLSVNLFPSVIIRVKATGMCLVCVCACVRAALVLFLTCQMCAEIKSSGVSDSLPWLRSDFAMFILFSLWLEKDTSASFKEACCSTGCSPVTSVSKLPASWLMDSWKVPLPPG